MIKIFSQPTTFLLIPLILAATPSLCESQSEFNADVWLRANAMETVEGRLGRVLSRYYEGGLGGADVYERVESFRFEGVYRTEAGEFPIRVFKKKPNLIKISITLPGQNSWTMGYNGKVAWQQRPDVNEGSPEKMDAAQRDRFLVDSVFISHLLYPKLPWKEIELVDTVPLDGRVCHKIAVQLPGNYVVTYFVDVRSNKKYSVVTTDKSTGRVTTSKLEDFVSVGGMPINRRAINIEDGEVTSTIEIDRIETNVGLATWIFDMPEH